MLKKLRTEIIFSIALLMGLLGVTLLLNVGATTKTIPYAVLAHGVITWALVKSDSGGFIKIRGMPRAGDPQREFHPVQSFLLFLIAVIQVGISAYLILVG